MAKKRRKNRASQEQAEAPRPEPRPKRRTRLLWILAVAAAFVLALISIDFTRCHADPMRAASEPRKAGEPNRLIHEDSPYLRGAAQQPVDWYPFGPEAFQRAQELDRPILLDIGAVWCHWCHVMDRESYENPEIARLINEMFVAVKVDRDARPDIDIRYQRTVQALTGQGGWPLTAFLTPDGKAFYGGTYFPAESKSGRPGLRELLPQVSQTYRTQKDRLLAAADDISRRLQAYESDSAKPGEVTPALVEAALKDARNDFDPEYGGQTGAPKFPHGAVVQLLLDRYYVAHDPKLLEIAEKTLEGMGRGGLRDHVNGGFYRYSTDRFWHVPHFEKMAYVQAELLAAYAQAYQATGKLFYRDAAQDIAAYLTDTLSDQAQGGFYASQDADVNLDDDGTYYTWSLAEIQKLLAPDEARAFAARFGIVAAPDRHPPTTPDRNVLYVAKSVEQIGAEMKLPASRVEELLASARQKLRTARRGQQTPFVDKTKFIGWNALVLSAYRCAYEALGDESLKNFALRTTDFLLAKAYRPGQGMYHAVFEGKARTPELLEDQAYMSLALLDMYEISGEKRYFDAARDLMDYALAHLWDEKSGGFSDAAHGEDFVEILRQPRREIEDAPLPGSNAVAALALDRLFHLTGEERYRKKAEETLAAFAGSAPQMGTFAATYSRAADYHLSNPLRVVITGKKQDSHTQDLWRSALATYRPHKIVLLRDGTGKDSGPLPPALKAQIDSAPPTEAPRSFICVGATCLQATSDLTRQAELIRTFGLERPQAAQRLSTPRSR